MDLSQQQVDCLNAMGIELLQSKTMVSEPIIAVATAAESRVTESGAAESGVAESGVAEYSVTVPAVAIAAEQSPQLITQLEQAISYCQQHNKKAVELSWQVDVTLEQIQLKDHQLALPNLATVFASTSLKRQLWQLIHQAS
ncbi:MAG: hypothetical protein HRU22_11650 [Gammaproteobacteria bacterium]|nr:hypothetical protein [Gammaproteobacteria bacterium]